MDDAAWAALTLSLTVLGAIWTWVSFRRRGFASGLRALAFTLLPLAAYLTRTLRMFTRIADAIVDWATSLVFNPLVWSGVVVAGVSVVLFVVSGLLRSRRRRGRTGEPKPVAGGRTAKPVSRSESQAAGSDDTDLAEIEELLRKRGIS